MSRLQEQCRALKLGHVYRIYRTVPFREREQFLAEVFAAELAARQENRTRRALKRAGFTQRKTLDTFEWQGITLPAHTTREQLTELSFLDRCENLILVGAVGTGKTHLATALGIQACLAGKEVRFFRTAELANRLLDHHAAGTLGRVLREIERAQLLILDELGFVPLHRHGAELLFNVIAGCYERRSVIVTTNLEFGQWNTVLADNRLTAALIDRLVHHAHILAFSGESYRLRHALSRRSQPITAPGQEAMPAS